MERRFKTSNHSNEQAKRISIEALTKKEKGKKRMKREDRTREENGAGEARNTRFLSALNRDSEDADDYDSSREIHLRRFRLFDENIQGDPR